MYPVLGTLRGLRQDGQDSDRTAAGRGSGLGLIKLFFFVTKTLEK